MERRLTALEIVYQRREPAPRRAPVDWRAVQGEIPDAFRDLSAEECEEFFDVMARLDAHPGNEAMWRDPEAWRRFGELECRIHWPDFFWEPKE